MILGVDPKVDRLEQLPPILKALEDLRILTQSDIEREQYEASRKAQLDRNEDLRIAREAQQLARKQGLATALAAGQKIGVIRPCERRLKRPGTLAEKLAGLSLEELTKLADEVQVEPGCR